MALTKKQQWILAGTLIVGGAAVYIQASRSPLIKPTKVIWQPPVSQQKKNQIFLAIREEAELEPYLQNHTPLLLNFVYRGQTASNKMTGTLQRLLLYDTDKLVNMVDVEADSLDNKELLLTYTVSKIPTLVAIKDRLPRGWHVDTDLLDDPENNEVNYKSLKDFVEKHAIDDPNKKKESNEIMKE